MAKIAFTAGRVAAFTCPPDRQQAFLWDDDVKGLGLRAKRNGAPAYIFQRQHDGKTVRITIGSPGAWTIPMAREKARELQRQIDEGHNPAEVKRDAIATKAAEREAAKAAADAEAARQARAERTATLTVGEAWAAYITDRTPHWSARHLDDHVKLSAAGGRPAMRGKRTTIAGPLNALMIEPLGSLTPERIEQWAKIEATTRPTRARLAWRLLRAFLSWCQEQKDFAPLVPANVAKNKRAREALGKPKAKQDALLREQLPGWFAAVRQIENPAIAAALQFLLLTGCRLNEALGLRWDDVNVKWKGITMHDKVEGERVIPLTPCVAQMLAALPRRNELVFSSPTAKDGAVTRPHRRHVEACAVAGIEGLTLHGLRRSFGTLTEWLEIPAGVVAQIMGHKPSATAEKHYRVRPLDLLRVHHERIEAWMLEQAGVAFQPQAEPKRLHAIK